MIDGKVKRLCTSLKNIWWIEAELKFYFFGTIQQPKRTFWGNVEVVVIFCSRLSQYPLKDLCLSLTKYFFQIIDCEETFFQKTKTLQRNISFKAPRELHLIHQTIHCVQDLAHLVTPFYHWIQRNSNVRINFRKFVKIRRNNFEIKF